MLFLGLRGTGKTVLLNELANQARDLGFLVSRLEAPEKADLVKMLYPEVKKIMRSLSTVELTKDLASRGMQAVKRFAANLKIEVGGVEISEQDNVSKVLTAVVEGSCEVGTTYYSDTYGYEDDLDILQTVSYDLTGDVIYPIARVVNEEADDAQTAAAEDFLQFILSDEAKAVFDSYYFDTNV